jgi:hypothetical protein
VSHPEVHSTVLVVNMRLSMRLVWLAVVALLVLCATPATASTASATRPTAVVTLTDANFDELTATGSWMLEFYGQGQEGRGGARE